MEFGAIRLSHSLIFPAKFPGKSYSLSQVLFRDAIFHPASGRSIPSVSATTENDGVSISEKFSDQKDGARRLAATEERLFNFGRRKAWVHFVGVGGCGLSALAMLALKQGFEVSGSDIAWSSQIERLNKAGARLHIGHSISNVYGSSGSQVPDAFVVSSAIPNDNVEILHAKSLGIPIYKRDCWLGMLTKHHHLIAVAGTHGKSTTTGMLAFVLKAMGVDFTAVVGAQVPQFPEGNIIVGGGHDNFLLEADEYDGCFLELSPYMAVITNLEWEHVDLFENEEAIQSIFRCFLDKIRADGHLILCKDSPGAHFLLDHIKHGHRYKITTYGMSSNNDWHASSISTNSHGGSNYVLFHRGCPLADISMQIPGIHNILNSLAVIATVVELLRDKRDTHELIQCLKRHLHNFIGISRRFEMIGKVHGCHIYDDYAHHPTEVRAVLQAARQKFPHKALLVVFQPHTYSRLAAMKNDFANALSAADQVVVSAVYAARETNKWNISAEDLAASIVGPPSEYIPSLGSVVDKLVLQISRNPQRELVVLTLGAGDITTVARKLFCELLNKTT